MTRVNPVSPFPQTNPTKLWRDFREYVAMVFASQRPHSTLVWPGRGQSLEEFTPGDPWWWRYLCYSLCKSWQFCRWLVYGYTHTFRLQKPWSKIFPPPPPWSPAKVFPRAGGTPGLPFLKRLSQESFPILLSSILHLAVTLQLFLRRESMGHAKTPRSHSTGPLQLFIRWAMSTIWLNSAKQ